MALLADYHIHSKHSRHNHGKSTIEDLTRAAYEKGLRQIAISDHGFNQKRFVNVAFSINTGANIISFIGKLRAKLFVVISFHRAPPNFLTAYTLILLYSIRFQKSTIKNRNA